ncbi:MAG: endonuclease/exonuclease/phosphatase family protein [Jatrophihabitans sp.]|uniref:endonuclease/exonuclease/phosphatase family protein n=1 Tax=Jatrophihabitans sp. TaxID=1932789 RepID=UPI003F816FCA
MRRFARAVLFACVLVTGVAVAAPADASTSLGTPGHQRVAAVTATSFTVSTDRAAGARSYRLFASTTYSDVWLDNLTAGHHSTALRVARATAPRLTIAGLRYGTATWFVRMEAVAGARHRYASTIVRLGLRPSTPSTLRAHSSAAGTWLTWDGVASTGYDVQQATDAAMTRDVRTYAVRAFRSAAQQFTPPARTVGRTYYWRVRAWNNGTRSGWTTPAHATVRTRLGHLRLMTYNLLNLNNTAEPDGTPIAPWSQRAAPAATVVLQHRPDVIGVEEGAEFVDAGRTTRQVQSFVAALDAQGGHFALADTATPFTTDTLGRYSGNYIAYDTTAVEQVGSGGYWTLDDDTSCGHNAVFAEFHRLDSPVSFLYVVTHAPNLGTDANRRDETARLIALGSAEAAQLHVPVVYGGDFNSYPQWGAHPVDGPQVAMAAADIADDETVALTRTNAAYNTINEYRNPPARFGTHIDYLWLPPGVAGTSWDNQLVLTGAGRFPGVPPSDHNPVSGDVWIPFA